MMRLIVSVYFHISITGDLSLSLSLSLLTSAHRHHWAQGMQSRRVEDRITMNNISMQGVWQWLLVRWGVLSVCYRLIFDSVWLVGEFDGNEWGDNCVLEALYLQKQLLSPKMGLHGESRAIPFCLSCTGCLKQLTATERG